MCLETNKQELISENVEQVLETLASGVTQESGRNEFGYDHSLEKTTDAVGVDADEIEAKVKEITTAWFEDQESGNSMLIQELERNLSKKELAVLATEGVLDKIVSKVEALKQDPFMALMQAMAQSKDA